MSIRHKIKIVKLFCCMCLVPIPIPIYVMYAVSISISHASIPIVEKSKEYAYIQCIQTALSILNPHVPVLHVDSMGLSRKPGERLDMTSYTDILLLP